MHAHVRALAVLLVAVLLAGCGTDRHTTRGAPSDAALRSVATAQQSSPEFEVHRRLAIVYVQVELHWVMRGRYPESLRELVMHSPRFLFPALGADVTVDPYSRYELPLRYRVTDDGPELASIGPDRRWGGWPNKWHVNLYSLDDVHLTRANIGTGFQRYLHASWFLAERRGKIARVPIWANYTGTELETAPDLRAFLRDRMPTRELRASTPKGLIEEMEEGFNMLLGVHGTFATPEETGFDTWYPRGPELGRISFYEAVDILMESTPSWIQGELFSEKAYLSTALGHGHAEHEELYSFLALLPDECESTVSFLVSSFPYESEKVTFVFPSEWFDDEQLDRLREAFARMWPHDPPQVRRIQHGVAV